MGDFHIKRIVLPSGKTVEIVYYQSDEGEAVISEVQEMRWQLALRCPDCEWRHTDTYDAVEVERFDDVLNDATDRLIEELDRVTRENMNEAVDRFRIALDQDGILPFDF